MGLEILHRILTADYSPIEPAALGDRVGMDKGVPYRTIQRVRERLNE